MNYEFWSRTSKRNDNPTLNSKLMTNLLAKQPQQQQPTKTDFIKPIKINERVPDSIRRSYSQLFKQKDSRNPQQINLNEKSSSRMSNFGSSSLRKLPVLNNDVEVYQKQRKGRQLDIISQVPKQYRDVIKVFPKYRFQTLDNEYWRRKSFIEGQPQNAYNFYSSNSRIVTQSRKFDTNQGLVK